MKKIILLLLISFLGQAQTLIKFSQIQRATDASSVVVTNTAGILSYTPTFPVSKWTNDAGYLTTTTATAWQLLGNTLGNNTSIFGSTDNRSFKVFTNNVYRMKFDSIGTNTIHGNLAVNGNSLAPNVSIYADQTMSQAPLLIDGGAGANAIARLQGTLNSVWQLRNSVTNGSWFGGNNVAAGVAGLDAFFIGKSTVANDAAFSIGTDDHARFQYRVKIGDLTAASAMLHIAAGTATLAPMLMTTQTTFSSGTAGALWYTSPNFNFNGGSIISGNTRIGSTTAPTATLDVAGTMSVSGNGTVSALAINGNSLTPWHLAINNEQSGNSLSALIDGGLSSNAFLRLQGTNNSSISYSNATTGAEWRAGNNTVSGANLDDYAIANSSNPAVGFLGINYNDGHVKIKNRISIGSALSTTPNANVQIAAGNATLPAIQLATQTTFSAGTAGAFWYTSPSFIGEGSFKGQSTSNSIANIWAHGSGTATTGNGVRIGSGNTTSTARDWCWMINDNTFGDISLRVGASQGSDPFVGTRVMTIDRLGRVGINKATPSASLDVTGTMSVSSTATIVGNLSAPHIIGNSTAPTIAAGSGLGTGAGTVVSLTRATDLSGIIGVVTGTASLGTTSDLAVITFNAAYGAAPNIILTPANAAAANLIVGTNIYLPAGSVGTTSFAPSTNTVALGASQTFSFFYQVVQ